MDANLAAKISKSCLNGHPIPSGLEKLWLATTNGDAFLAEHLGIELLTSLALLDDGYSVEIAQGDPTALANVRAHRRIFRHVGFFAGCHERQLAFDFASKSDSPPVVRLDSEGQYDWQGIDVAEAISRIGEELQVAETDEWLRSIGLPVGTTGEIGASTQFLASISDLHERYYYEEIGTPKASLPSSTTRAQPNDPVSWIMRPGDEVRLALLHLLKMPPDTVLSRQWVQCDGEGRVCTVWFHPVPETMAVAVGRISFGMSPSQATGILGKPTRTGDGWMSFSNPAGRLRVGFDKKELNEICLMAE